MTSLHPNSLEAYREILPRLPMRSRNILAVLGHGEMHERTIKERLGLPDMNGVRPRVTEMIDAGILEEAGSAVDPVTNSRVRVVRVKQRNVQGVLSF